MKLNDSPLMIIAISLQRAGGIKPLTYATGLDTSTIYGWLKFKNVPSEYSIEKLQKYLGIEMEIENIGYAPVKHEFTRAESSPVQVNRLPKPTFVEDLVAIQRHGHSVNGHPIMFGVVEGTDETVFVPPSVSYELVEKLGGIIPRGTKAMMSLAKDVTGRSDFAAKGLI